MAQDIPMLVDPASKRARYEFTVAMPNGDWHWTRETVDDFQAALEYALAYAATFPGARVHHIEKLGAR